MMNRQQKEVVISDFKKMFTSNSAAFIVGYQGLTVAQLQSLRKNIRTAGGTFKVTKARLIKIATEKLDGCDDFRTNLKNQIGLVFVKEEIPTVAKKLVDFSKQNEQLNIVSGLFESRTISRQEIEYLASIPSKEVLLAQMMGSLQAPVYGLVRALDSLVKKLQGTLQQVSENKENKE